MTLKKIPRGRETFSASASTYKKNIARSGLFLWFFERTTLSGCNIAPTPANGLIKLWVKHYYTIYYVKEQLNIKNMYQCISLCSQVLTIKTVRTVSITVITCVCNQINETYEVIFQCQRCEQSHLQDTSLYGHGDAPSPHVFLCDIDLVTLRLKTFLLDSSAAKKYNNL